MLMTDLLTIEDILRDLNLNPRILGDIMSRERTTIIEDYVFELDLSGLKIKHIPPAIMNLEFLEELDLSYNDISRIPEFIIDMENLRKVYLFDNAINKIPDIFTPIADIFELEPHKQLPGYAELVDLTTDSQDSSQPPVSHYMESEPARHREIKPQRTFAEEPRAYYFKLGSRLEMERVKYLLDVYRERTCCKLSGRLDDKYCMLCGRVIPDFFRVES